MADPPSPPVGYLIWHLALKWRTAMDRALTPHQLTNVQYSALASLHGLTRSGARPSQRELADASGLEPMYVSKIVRELERNGLVARSVNPADPRAVRLSLTAQGRRTVTAAADTVRSLHDRLLEPVGGSHSARTSGLAAELRLLLQHAIQATGDRPTQPGRKS